MHQAAFEDSDPQPPVFPLTVEGINKIASLFKAGGYLSYHNYVLRAKGEHMTAGGDVGYWSQDLALAVRQTIRSVGRGAGASRQSLPVDLFKIVELNFGDVPFSNDGPIGVVEFAILGCLFLLRETQNSKQFRLQFYYTSLVF